MSWGWLVVGLIIGAILGVAAGYIALVWIAESVGSR